MSKSKPHNEKCRYDFSPDHRQMLRCQDNAGHWVLLLDLWREARLREMLKNGYLTGKAKEEAMKIVNDF